MKKRLKTRFSSRFHLAGLRRRELIALLALETIRLQAVFIATASRKRFLRKSDKRKLSSDEDGCLLEELRRNSTRSLPSKTAMAENRLERLEKR
jgi:hypothetical protein